MMDFWKNNRLLLHLLIGAILTAVYPMQSLFSGNQNVYFLWGLAEELPSNFAGDALLNSPDPYPIFSWLISLFPFEFWGIWTTVLYILLNAIYSFSFFGIVNQFSKIYSSASRFLGVLVLFLLLHSSPIWGSYLSVLFDIDLRWIWDSGIAEQGVLRGYLQPSAFGVFLLLSFYLAMTQRTVLALFAIAPAALIHANYLLLGGLLAIVYVFLHGRKSTNYAAATILLLIVSPYVYYICQNFVFISDELKIAIADAVQEDFSHNIHLNPKNWINAKFFIQITIVITALVISRNSKFFKLLITTVSIASGLSLVAFLTENSILLSLNPWRLSIVIVPVSVAILVGKFLSSGGLNFQRLLAILVLPISFGYLTLRIFGNSSETFQITWLSVQFATVLTLLLAMNILLKRWPNTISKILSIASIFALLIVGITELLFEEKFRIQSEQFEAISQLEEDKPNTVYIVPPHWTSFRMNAQKAVFVDDNLVYGPALPGILHRKKLVANATDSGDYSVILKEIDERFSVKLITETEPNPNQEKISSSHWLIELRK